VRRHARAARQPRTGADHTASGSCARHARLAQSVRLISGVASAPELLVKGYSRMLSVADLVASRQERRAWRVERGGRQAAVRAARWGSRVSSKDGKRTDVRTAARPACSRVCLPSRRCNLHMYSRGGAGGAGAPHRFVSCTPMCRC